MAVHEGMGTGEQMVDIRKTLEQHSQQSFQAWFLQAAIEHTVS